MLKWSMELGWQTIRMGYHSAYSNRERLIYPKASGLVGYSLLDEPHHTQLQLDIDLCVKYTARDSKF